MTVQYWVIFPKPYGIYGWVTLLRWCVMIKKNTYTYYVPTSLWNGFTGYFIHLFTSIRYEKKDLRGEGWGRCWRNIPFLLTLSLVFFCVACLSVWDQNTILLIIVKPIRHQTKIAADDILIFYFYLSKKIRLDFSCEDSVETSSYFFWKTMKKYLWMSSAAVVIGAVRVIVISESI